MALTYGQIGGGQGEGHKETVAKVTRSEEAGSHRGGVGWSAHEGAVEAQEEPRGEETGKTRT